MSEYSISPLIRNRWSPRSMSGEEMSDEELFPLFEAARWAPSSYNNQPWRFIYAKRGTAEWDTLFGLLIDFNKRWVKQAAVLLVVISHNTFERNSKPSRTHSFDTGAAWMSLALEGSHRGYVVHGMEGFNYDEARTLLAIPANYTVEAMVAIGKKAPEEQLPEDLRASPTRRERHPVTRIIMHGKFLEKNS